MVRKNHNANVYRQLGDFQYAGIEGAINLDYLPFLDQTRGGREGLEVHIELDVARGGLVRVAYSSKIPQDSPEVFTSDITAAEQDLIDYLDTRLPPR